MATLTRQQASKSAPLQWLLAGVVLVSLDIPLRAAPPELKPPAPRRAVVPDTELVNQDGNPVRLYSDLMKDRVVAISFVFTSCPTTCSLIGVNLGQLQKELGPLLGKEIALISITIDPANDTPAKLKAWSQQFHARAEWTLLTGAAADVDGLLKKLQVFTPDLRSHSPFMLVVNDQTGEWTRINILTTPAHSVAKSLHRLVAGNRSTDETIPETSGGR